MDKFSEQLAMAAMLNPALSSRLPTTSEPNSQPCSETEHEQHLVKLWIVMTEAYGYRWFKPMGESPNQTWAQGLRELTTEQWHAGLKMLSKSTDDWPPSLPEFRRWCTAQRTKEQLRAYADQQAAEIMAARVGRYNPNVTPMTYAQEDRERERLARQIFVMEQDNDRHEAMGIEKNTDPRRICQDEDYR
jgi:hypothetical protein